MKNYVRTNWVDNVTPVNACNLNKIENALLRLASNKLEADDVIEGDGIHIEIVNGKIVISLMDTPIMPGGIDDYNQLKNIPKINGVALQGDLTPAHLGINNITEEQFNNVRENITNLWNTLGTIGLETIETNEDGFFIVDEHLNIGITVSPDGEFNVGRLSQNLLTQIKESINVWE